MKFSLFAPRLVPVARNSWHNLMATQQDVLRTYSSSKKLFTEITPTLDLEKNVPNLQNPILARELKTQVTRGLIEKSEKQLADLKLKFAQLQNDNTGSGKPYNAICNELLNQLSDAIRKDLPNFEMNAVYKECEVIDFLKPVLNQCDISCHFKPGQEDSYKCIVSVPKQISFPLAKSSISPESPIHIVLQIKFAKDLQKAVTEAYNANLQEHSSSPKF